MVLNLSRLSLLPGPQAAGLRRIFQCLTSMQLSSDLGIESSPRGGKVGVTK